VYIRTFTSNAHSIRCCILSNVQSRTLISKNLNKQQMIQLRKMVSCNLLIQLTRSRFSLTLINYEICFPLMTVFSYATDIFARLIVPLDVACMDTSFPKHNRTLAERINKIVSSLSKPHRKSARLW